jgi:hypothetical protein
MGTLRKYLVNGAIISSVLSGVSAFRQQRRAPNDWRTYLTWIAWALTLVVAIGTVRIESQDEDPTRPSHPVTSPGPKLKNPKQKKPKK